MFHTTNSADISPVIDPSGDEGEVLPADWKIADGSSLPELAHKINAAVSEAEASLRSATQLAIRAGALLREAKAGVTYGKWEQWLLEHCRVATTTAQAYMRLSKLFEGLPSAEAQRVADLPLREALKAIAGPTKPRLAREPAPDDRDDATRAEDARSVLTKWTAGFDAFPDMIYAIRELEPDRLQPIRDKLAWAIKLLDAAPNTLQACGT